MEPSRHGGLRFGRSLLVPENQPGRYVYLRDMESGKYWNPTAQPTPAVKPAL